jgi:hypothetical protein
MGKIRNPDIKEQTENEDNYEILPIIEPLLGRPPKKSLQVPIPHQIDIDALQVELFGLIMQALRGKPIGGIKCLTPTAWVRLVEVVADRRIIPIGIIKEDVRAQEKIVEERDANQIKKLLGVTIH